MKWEQLILLKLSDVTICKISQNTSNGSISDLYVQTKYHE
jgi:hypothetical protein